MKRTIGFIVPNVRKVLMLRTSLYLIVILSLYKMAEKELFQEVLQAAGTVRLKPLSKTSGIIASNRDGTLQNAALTHFEQSYCCKVSDNEFNRFSSVNTIW